MNELIKQNLKNNAIADFLGMNWTQLKATNKGAGKVAGVMTPSGDIFIIKIQSELERMKPESDVVTHFHHGWHWFQIERVRRLWEVWKDDFNKKEQWKVKFPNGLIGFRTKKQAIQVSRDWEEAENKKMSATN